MTEAPSGGRFVVQRHRATRLHYDLRLEIGGVLVSWAVPKGPTLDPDVRRLAVRVDDHGLEHLTFEGVIGDGTFGAGGGAGDVIVWDRGTWSTDDGVEAAAAVTAGELHVDLHGDKLVGRFALVRRRSTNEWLLVHKHDSAAVRGWNPDEHPRSVISGRTNDEVRESAEPPSDATHEEAEHVMVTHVAATGVADDTP